MYDIIWWYQGGAMATLEPQQRRGGNLITTALYLLCWFWKERTLPLWNHNKAKSGGWRGGGEGWGAMITSFSKTTTRESGKADHIHSWLDGEIKEELVRPGEGEEEGGGKSSRPPLWINSSSQTTSKVVSHNRSHNLFLQRLDQFI